MATRFSWHFLRYAQEAAAAGLTTNAELAHLLRRWDDSITTADVSKWRVQYPKFDRVCKDALAEINAEVSSKVLEAIREGDVASGRWWLERRAPAFMPKSKTEHTGADALDDVLKRRRLTDEELKAKGVLIDPDEDEELETD